MTALERAAVALMNRQRNRYGLSSIGVGMFDVEEMERAKDLARAVLLAVRWPDDSVCDAGNNADYGCTEGIGLDRLLLGPDFGPWQHGLRSVFSAMIDAILNEITKEVVS